MLPRLGRAAALAGLLVLPAPAWAADSLATEEGQTLDVRHLSPEQRRRLLAGDTIAYQVLETSETEIGAGVAMYLSVPLARAAEVLTSPDVVLKDPSITTSGLIPAPATAAALQGFKLASGEMNEAREVLEAEAGLRFNFTLAESEAFRAAKSAPRGCARDGGRPVADPPSPARTGLPGAWPRRRRALRAAQRHERPGRAPARGRGRRPHPGSLRAAPRRGAASLPGRPEPHLDQPDLLGEAPGPGPAHADPAPPPGRR